MRKFVWLFIGIILAVVLVSALPVAAQQTYSSGPVPAQIGTAKKAFISNAGGECAPFGKAVYSSGPDTAYDEFYSAMKSWGQLTLVGAPADADLVLQIHFTCPFYFAVDNGRVDAQFRVTFIDPKTGIVLWAVTEHSQTARSKSKLDKEFDKSMVALVADVKGIVQLAGSSSK